MEDRVKKSVLSLVLVLASNPLANAMDIPLTTGSTRGTGVHLIKDELGNKDLPTLTIEATIKNLSATEVKARVGTFTHLSIPGFQISGEIGSPALPVMNRLIEIPLGATPEVTVTASRSQKFSLADLKLPIQLMPRQPPQPKNGTVVPFQFDASSYQAKGFQKEALATIKVVGQLRHVRLALLSVAPVAYDPVEGKIEVTNDLSIEISLKGADLDETAFVKQQYGSPYFESVYEQTISPESLRSMPANDSRPPCYVIVADNQFEQQLEPFVNWRMEKGFDVVKIYGETVVTSPTAVQAEIRNLYNNPTEDRGAPTFVLFVGDHDNVPAMQGETEGHITDLYYSAVTDDYLPDILTGRFSARTPEELAPQIAKTLTYEKYELQDPSYLQRVVMVAGWDPSFSVEWGYPQINYGIANYFNESNGITTQGVFLSASDGENEPEIVQAVSNGAAYVNYTAHGSSFSWADPAFEISDINGLAEGFFTFAVGNCCITNTFEEGTCFGEAWLRAANKGAIGYIGGSNSTYWDEDLWWGTGYYAIAHPNEEGAAPPIGETGDGAYDKLFHCRHTTGAGMMIAGNLAVEASTSDLKLYYWEIYHLMGDPSLMVYIGLPKDNPVEHASTVAAEAGSFEVKAAVGSCVAVSIDGTLHGTAFASAEGVAQVNLKAMPTEGTAKIVVTGKNLKPYTGEIAIGQSGSGR